MQYKPTALKSINYVFTIEKSSPLSSNAFPRNYLRVCGGCFIKLKTTYRMYVGTASYKSPTPDMTAILSR